MNRNKKERSLTIKFRIMNQQKKDPELPPTPHKPEIKPAIPEKPKEAPHPEISPEKDPSPSKNPPEIVPGKERNVIIISIS